MPDTLTPTIPWAIAPYFIVKNVVKSATFYRDILGFTYERFCGEPACFCMVKRNGITIMLSQITGAQSIPTNGHADPHQEAWDTYIWVPNVDALKTELENAGCKIARDICTQEYGCRDFDVLDIDGYRLCFGQSI